jgi:hypothetical protein
MKLPALYLLSQIISLASASVVIIPADVPHPKTYSPDGKLAKSVHDLFLTSAPDLYNET